MTFTCGICKETFPNNYDCGEDCYLCLAEAGDPDCVDHAIRDARSLFHKLNSANNLIIDLHEKLNKP